MNRALNFGETLPIIKREEALKKWKNYYLGYDRYVESLKK